MGYNYNRDQMVYMLLMTVIVVVGLTRSVKAQPATATCAEKLTSCASYLKNSTNPPASCCNPIKQAVAHELPCLCNLYTTPGFLASIGVNVTQALLLTKNCGVPIELNKCKNSSAESPHSPSTRAHGGNGATDRISSVGISVLLLFCVSIIF